MPSAALGPQVDTELTDDGRDEQGREGKMKGGKERWREGEKDKDRVTLGKRNPLEHPGQHSSLVTSSLYKEEKMNYHTFCEFPASKHTTKAQAQSAGTGKLFALNNRAWRW